MHGVSAVGMSTLHSPPGVRSAGANAAVPFQQVLLDAIRKLDTLRQSTAAPPGMQSLAQQQAATQALRTAEQLQGAVLSAYHEIKEMGG